MDKGTRAKAVSSGGAFLIATALQVVTQAWPTLLKPHPWVVGLLLLASVVMFIYAASGNKDKEVSTKMQTSRDVSGMMFQADTLNYHEAPAQKIDLLDLELEIKEITFNATRTGGLSVFVYVKGLLKNPRQLDVAYSLVLVTHGVAIHFEHVHDLYEWMCREKTSVDFYHGDGAFQIVQPMPSSMEAGVYAEGWLHFVSQETHDPRTLDCTVRLRADTSVGKLEKERHGVTFKGTGYQMLRKEYQ